MARFSQTLKSTKQDIEASPSQNDLYSRQSLCDGHAPQSGLRAGSEELLGIRNLDV
jgi:hypothetical protein